jgi:hypothetical protein
MAMAMALLAMPGSAQDAGVYRNTLTNRDVITLADAGFSEEFLVEMVTTSRTRFDTTAEGLADLAKHGVKEDLIRAMRGVHSEAPASAPAAPASGPEKPVRVFVQAGASAAGLSRPDRQTAEIVRTFGQTCSNVVVTSRREAAAFTVVLEYKSGNLLHRGGSRMVVFDRAGDMVYGASERALGKALRGFCMAGQGFLGSAAGGGAGGVPDALPGAR